MRRRDFLRCSAGLAGGLLPQVGRAQTTPCPPGHVSVTGGTQRSTACAAGNVEADWLLRSTGPGVVWAHDFRNAAEFDQFYYKEPCYTPGLSYQSTTSRVLDSTGYWCVENRVPKGVPDGYLFETHNTTGGFMFPDSPSGIADHLATKALVQKSPYWVDGNVMKRDRMVATGRWWRPYSAFNAGSNGLATPDRADLTLPRYNWSRDVSGTDGTSMGMWYVGYYAQEDEQTANANYNGIRRTFDGTEYFIQFKVKMNANRWNPPYVGNQGASNRLSYYKQPGGKMAFFSTTGDEDNGYFIFSSLGKSPVNVERSHIDLYTSRGSFINSGLGEPQTAGPQPNGTRIQPGGSHTGVTGGVNQDLWTWPADEWVTVQVQVIMGRENRDAAISRLPLASWPYHDFGIRIWVAKQSNIDAAIAAGKTPQYELIWEKLDYAWYYNYSKAWKHPPAHNALDLQAYMNNVPAYKEFYHRFTQVIFSRKFIPCPQG